MSYTCGKNPNRTIVTVRPSGGVVSTRHPMRRGVHVRSGAFEAFSCPILCTGDATKLLFEGGAVIHARAFPSTSNGPCIFCLGNYGGTIVRNAMFRKRAPQRDVGARGVGEGSLGAAVGWSLALVGGPSSAPSPHLTSLSVLHNFSLFLLIFFRPML